MTWLSLLALAKSIYQSITSGLNIVSLSNPPHALCVTFRPEDAEWIGVWSILQQRHPEVNRYVFTPGRLVFLEVKCNVN